MNNTITKESVMHNLGYFETLCKRLDETKQYVDYSLDNNGEFANKNTYSWEFLQIILLASMEFESIAKQLCLNKNSNFKEGSYIVDITKEMVSIYPNIVLTEVNVGTKTIKPLDGWGYDSISKSRKGLQWWNTYINLKHRSYDYFQNATLEIAVNVLSSLLVLELYLAKEILGSPDFKFPFFSHKYISYNLSTGTEEQLPDF